MKATALHKAVLPLMLGGLLLSHVALGDDRGRENPMPCPILPYDGITPMDVEFMGNVEANTQCLRNRHHAKVIVSVSRPFMMTALGQPQRARATFFANLEHLTRNYENIHGMTIGKDVDVAVILVESGALLATQQHAIFNTAGTTPVTNPFISQINDALAKGIKIYVCQTAMRSLGLKAPDLIPGLRFVPGGQIAVADFQMQGYGLILP